MSDMTFTDVSDGQNSNKPKHVKKKKSHNSRRRKPKVSTVEEISPSGIAPKPNKPSLSKICSISKNLNPKVDHKVNNSGLNSNCTKNGPQSKEAVLHSNLSNGNIKEESKPKYEDSVFHFFYHFDSKTSVQLRDEFGETEAYKKCFVSEIENTILSNNARRCLSVENDNVRQEENVDEETISMKKKLDRIKVSDDNKKSNKKATKEKGSQQYSARQRVFVNSEFKSNSDRDNSSTSERCLQIVPKKQKKKKGAKAITKSKTDCETCYPRYFDKDEMDYVSKCGLLLSGFIRINKSNFYEAYIPAPDGGMDILVKGLIDRNRALEGDEVYFVVRNEKDFRIGSGNEIQKTAAVIALKKEVHDRTAVGTFQKSHTGETLFCPRDCRIPKIRITDFNSVSVDLSHPKFYSDKLFRARIQSWTSLQYADGNLIEEIGPVGDIEAETKGILRTYGLNTTPYSDFLKSYLPAIPYIISEEEIAAREDWRKECVFTIDPEGAKDLDDAVSCKTLSNGNFEIGVHISDVTYFLQEGSPLDKEVCNRATTIYLVQKVFHMLPRELCELCSLTPNEDKLTFSVIWEITPDAEIVNSYFARTVIKSCGQLTYEQVQSVLEGQDLGSTEIYNAYDIATVTDKISNLNKIAAQLRERRFSNGALRIDQTKITFSLDENGLPTDYFTCNNNESHQLIEEFMLLANITVAEKINSCYPDIAFLRCHEPPVQHYLERIQKLVANYGVKLDITSSKAIHTSLLQYTGDDAESEAKRIVLNTLLAKPMKRAVYFCADTRPEEESKRHYALNVALYTHFTSPIRRYADVMVHRLLAAALGYRKKPNWSSKEVTMIAENCNVKKYAAKMAGEKSTEFFLTLYLLKMAPAFVQAIVFDIKEKSLDCTRGFGSKYKIYFKEIDGKPSVTKKKGVPTLTVSWPERYGLPESSQVINMFSIVSIELRESKKNLKATLVRDEIAYFGHTCVIL